MTKNLRALLSISALALAVGLTSPAAFAQDKMGKDGMTKDSMSKDAMSKDGMKKDDAMAKDGMKKHELHVERQHVEGRHVEGRHEEVTDAASLTPAAGPTPCSGLLPGRIRPWPDVTIAGSKVLQNSQQMRPREGPADTR